VSARVGVSRIAIVVSNGNSRDAAATQEEADLTRRAGINIMAVAVGTWLDINELKGIVSYPAHRNTLQVSSYESFGSVVHTIRDAVCGSEYLSTLLSYTLGCYALEAKIFDLGLVLVSSCNAGLVLTKVVLVALSSVIEITSFTLRSSLIGNCCLLCNNLLKLTSE